MIIGGVGILLVVIVGPFVVPVKHRDGEKPSVWDETQF